MRPTVELDGPNLYECFVCGSRVTEPTAPVCGNCGGSLRNLTRSRDL